MSSRVGPLLMALLLGACATVSTSPEINPSSRVAPSGQLEFVGNKEFLPEPLAALPEASADSRVVYRYRYDVTYHDTDMSVLALFNPLSLVGCPTGSVSLRADATLEVVSEGRVARRYTARSDASRLRTIYSGDPLSDIRRAALQAAARSIAGQIAGDAAALSKIGETDKSHSLEVNGGAQ